MVGRGNCKVCEWTCPLVQYHAVEISQPQKFGSEKLSSSIIILIILPAELIGIYFMKEYIIE